MQNVITQTIILHLQFKFSEINNSEVALKNGNSINFQDLSRAKIFNLDQLLLFVVENV